MANLDSCNEVFVIIEWKGHIIVSLSDWVAGSTKSIRDLRDTYLVTPIGVRCDDKVFPITALPLKYRNNNLSRFLIRWGLLESAWD